MPAAPGRGQVMSVLSKAVGGLTEGLRRQVGDGAFMDGRADYVADFRDNLVPGVQPGMFEADLRRGKGGELEGRPGRPPKFHAAHSSAALAVNAFAPWTKEPRSLVLAGVPGFEEIRFEAPCDKSPTNSPKLSAIIWSFLFAGLIALTPIKNPRESVGQHLID